MNVSRLGNAVRPRAIVRSLLSSQLLAVLGTSGRNGAHSSLVAFASTRNLKHIFFATARATRKYANLKRDPRVSILLDNRTNASGDFRSAVAATVSGRASELRGSAKTTGLRLLSAKHKALKDFVSDNDSALFRVRAQKYSIAFNTQQLAEVRIR